MSRLIFLVIVVLFSGCAKYKINDVLPPVGSTSSLISQEPVAVMISSYDSNIKKVAPDIFKQYGLIATNDEKSIVKVNITTTEDFYMGPVSSFMMASTMFISLYAVPAKDIFYLDANANISGIDSENNLTVRYIASSNNYFCMNFIPLFIPGDYVDIFQSEDGRNSMKEHLAKLIVHNIASDIAVLTKRNFVSKKI